MRNIGSGLWPENFKRWQMRHKYCMTRNMVRNTEKREKYEMHTVGPGIWRET